MNYSKICNLSLDLDLSSLKGKEVNSYVGLGDGMLRYYLSADYTEIFSKFPQFTKIQPKIRLIAEIDGSGSIGPHVDHGPNVVLNWYFKSNQATTLFYRKKEDSVPFKAEGEDTANLYNNSDIELIDSFTAKDGDVYLLDVSKVHAVSSPKPGNRLFLSYSWENYTFDEILESIRLYSERN